MLYLRCAHKVRRAIQISNLIKYEGWIFSGKWHLRLHYLLDGVDELFSIKLEWYDQNISASTRATEQHYKFVYCVIVDKQRHISSIKTSPVHKDTRVYPCNLCGIGSAIPHHGHNLICIIIWWIIWANTDSYQVKYKHNIKQ